MHKSLLNLIRMSECLDFTAKQPLESWVIIETIASWVFWGVSHKSDTPLGFSKASRFEMCKHESGMFSILLFWHWHHFLVQNHSTQSLQQGFSVSDTNSVLSWPSIFYTGPQVSGLHMRINDAFWASFARLRFCWSA